MNCCEFDSDTLWKWSTVNFRTLCQFVQKKRGWTHVQAQQVEQVQFKWKVNSQVVQQVKVNTKSHSSFR